MKRCVGCWVQVAAGTAAAYGVSVEQMGWSPVPYPVTVNDPQLAALVSGTYFKSCAFSKSKLSRNLVSLSSHMPGVHSAEIVLSIVAHVFEPHHSLLRPLLLILMLLLLLFIPLLLLLFLPLLLLLPSSGTGGGGGPGSCNLLPALP